MANTISSAVDVFILNKIQTDTVFNDESIYHTLREYFKNDQDLDASSNQERLKSIGIAALLHFVRINWVCYNCTHHAVLDELVHFLTKSFKDPLSFLANHEKYIPSIMVIKVPEFLCLSYSILNSISSSNLIESIWKIRVLMIKQLIIGYPCQILFQSISDEIDKLKVYLEPFIEAAETEEEERECLTFVYLELSQIYLWYRHVQVSNDYLSKALHQAKIEVNLSARMGRRTKYQVRSKALLCVEVKRDTVQTPSEIRAERGFNARELAPKNVRLSDDTLLSKIIFEEEMPYLELTCEDEAVICGMVEHRIKSSCSSDVLNKEQASAYLDYLIERGKIWTVIYKSLFMRCLNERDSRRTLERAMTQLETLTDNIKVKSNYDCNLKMILFFSIMPDPIWTIEKAWADVLFSLGATKSALDVYDRLELWELTVSCLVR